MGDGRHIASFKGDHAPRVSGENRAPDGDRAPHPDSPASPHNGREKGAHLLNREWQNSQAAGRRGNLETIIARGEKDSGGRGNNAASNSHSGENVSPNPHRSAASTQPPAEKNAAPNSRPAADNFRTDTHQDGKNASANSRQSGNNLTAVSRPDGNNLSTNSRPDANSSTANPRANAKNLSADLRRSGENGAQIAQNPHAGRQSERTQNSFAPRQTERTQNPLNQTWESLVSRAKDHKDLARFRDQPKEFWNEVRRMSEVRVVETYAGGRMEPRAVSRYGELLDKFNRQGGRLETFLASLAPGERNVFLARHQLNQTFGASELFVGKGVALDKHGQFPARVFLSGNGKSPELAPHAVLSLLNGKSSGIFARQPFNFEGKQIFASPGGGNFDIAARFLAGDLSASEIAFLENVLLRGDGQILFSAKSAALLSLSLALYQNIDAMLSLPDLAPEVLKPEAPAAFAPKAAPDKTAQASARNAFENGRIADNGAPGENDAPVLAALISGALATMESYGRIRARAADLASNGGADGANSGFAAGATGAMMGATMGAVVPLAEKSVGEILSFAASVVVGLTDSGLRALGANALGAVVAGGVQTLLDASASDRASLADVAASKFLSPAEAARVIRDDLEQRLFSSRVTNLLPS